jgi:hypothetical protein
MLLGILKQQQQSIVGLELSICQLLDKAGVPIIRGTTAAVAPAVDEIGAAATEQLQQPVSPLYTVEAKSSAISTKINISHFNISAHGRLREVWFLLLNFSCSIK